MYLTLSLNITLLAKLVIVTCARLRGLLYCRLTVRQIWLHRVTSWFILWILLAMNLLRGLKRFPLKSYRLIYSSANLLTIIWVQKLIFMFIMYQSLLDLALRTTAAAADPCHEELTCCVVCYSAQICRNYSSSVLISSSTQERVSLLKRLATLKDLESSYASNYINPVYEGDDQLEPLTITGLETFCLSYKVVFFPFRFNILL